MSVLNSPDCDAQHAPIAGCFCNTCRDLFNRGFPYKVPPTLSIGRSRPTSVPEVKAEEKVDPRALAARPEKETPAWQGDNDYYGHWGGGG